MLVNIVVGILIFAYAGWVLYRSVKKSSEGKCTSCRTEKSCCSPQDSIEPIERRLHVQ